MSLNVNENKKNATSNFPRLEEGMYPARVVQVIDLGVQPVEDFKTGEVKGSAPKVNITFEFPTETIEIDDEEKPRWYGKDYKLSFHEKSALTALLTALKADDIDELDDILDMPLMITIGSTANNKPKITGVGPVPKRMKVDPLYNEARSFDFDDPDLDVFNSLPEFIQEKIKGANNYEGSPLQWLLNKIESHETESQDTESEDSDTEEPPWDDDED